MGYDLHITRAENWSDSDGPHISAAEWQSLVAADPELSPDPDNGPSFALWRGSGAAAEAWLAWSEPGDIFTKYPDRALVAKMLQLAERLGARVQGDDGEFYTDPSQVPANQPNQSLQRTAGDPKRLSSDFKRLSSDPKRLSSDLERPSNAPNKALQRTADLAPVFVVASPAAVAELGSLGDSTYA